MKDQIFTVSKVAKIAPYLGVYLDNEKEIGLAIYECMLNTPIKALEGKKIKVITGINDEILEIFDMDNNNLYKYDEAKLHKYEREKEEEKEKQIDTEGLRVEYIMSKEAQHKIEQQLLELPDNLKQDYFIISYKKPFSVEQYKDISSIYIQYSIAKKYKTEEELKCFFENKDELEEYYNKFILETGNEFIDIEWFQILIKNIFDYLQSNKEKSVVVSTLENQLAGIDGFIKYYCFQDVNLTAPYSREDYKKISYYYSLVQFLKKYKNSEHLKELLNKGDEFKKAFNNFIDPDYILHTIERKIMYEVEKYKTIEYLENFMSTGVFTIKIKNGDIKDSLGLNHDLEINEQTVLYAYLKGLKKLYNFLQKNNKLSLI